MASGMCNILKVVSTTERLAVVIASNGRENDSRAPPCNIPGSKNRQPLRADSTAPQV